MMVELFVWFHRCLFLVLSMVHAVHCSHKKFKTPVLLYCPFSLHCTSYSERDIACYRLIQSTRSTLNLAATSILMHSFQILADGCITMIRYEQRSTSADVSMEEYDMLYRQRSALSVEACFRKGLFIGLYDLVPAAIWFSSWSCKHDLQLKLAYSIAHWSCDIMQPSLVKHRRCY
jgi:hypothetical protein